MPTGKRRASLPRRMDKSCSHRRDGSFSPVLVVKAVINSRTGRNTSNTATSPPLPPLDAYCRTENTPTMRSRIDCNQSARSSSLCSIAIRCAKFPSREKERERARVGRREGGSIVRARTIRETMWFRGERTRFARGGYRNYGSRIILTANKCSNYKLLIRRRYSEVRSSGQASQREQKRPAIVRRIPIRIIVLFVIHIFALALQTCTSARVPVLGHVNYRNYAETTARTERVEPSRDFDFTLILQIPSDLKDQRRIAERSIGLLW